MTVPSVDIIVPVWNNPFETRSCLASIILYSPEARLIVVDNGSSRETELMLEEFSEPIGERGLFIKSERNLGMVPAINIGLARSDSDVAVILRPHVQVNDKWLDGLVQAVQAPHAGIVSPIFSGCGAPLLPPIIPGCSLMETFCVSFSALAIKGEIHMLLGGFDEGLDGGEWCLKDYIRRAWNRGYHTAVTPSSYLVCGQESIYGSDVRRQQQLQFSIETYRERWGVSQHYGIYFGKAATTASLSETMETIVRGARQGHRFTLLLHRSQAADFRRLGWHALHTGIELRQLSLLMPQRDLHRRMVLLKAAVPDMIPVRGVEGIDFPGMDTAISFVEMTAAIGSVCAGQDRGQTTIGTETGGIPP